MAKNLKMFGLAHCSTCQKAQKALEEHGWSVDFRDVQKSPCRARNVSSWPMNSAKRSSTGPA